MSMRVVGLVTSPPTQYLSPSADLMAPVIGHSVDDA